MSKAPPLTLEHLSVAPASAARVLQELPAEDAAALLERVPTRLAAPVIHNMIPWSAARCVEALSPHRAATILRKLAFRDSTSLLRLVTPLSRDAIFAEIEGHYVERLKNSLQYPLNQIGAWMDATVPVLAADYSVRDALRIVGESSVAVSHVFLELEEGQAFIGAISVRELLRSNLTAGLSQLSITRVEPVSNRATLSSIAFDSRWDDFLYLPVVSRRGAILGGISRNALRKGTSSHHVKLGSAAESPIARVLWALLLTATGLLKLFVTPVQTPALEESQGSSDAG